MLEAEHGRCKVPCRVRTESEEWVKGVLTLLFPHFRSTEVPHHLDLEQQAESLDLELRRLLEDCGQPAQKIDEVVETFWRVLPMVRENLLLDAHATDEFDPASESVDEVMLAYPGFFATAVYRIAHELDCLSVGLVPRLLSEFAHRETGIDIHPGAVIGVPVIIDHGTGLTIGQSTIIGKRVCLYQGVTLGALAVKKSMAKSKRHPTIEDDVVIYSGATILGGETVIGAGSVIGGNAWLTRSVPPGSVVTNRASRQTAETTP